MRQRQTDNGKGWRRLFAFPASSCGVFCEMLSELVSDTQWMRERGQATTQSALALDASNWSQIWLSRVG